MYILTLSKWYGRLGNNIIQIKNILHIALYYNCRVNIKPKHKYFDINIINKYFSKNKGKIRINNNFFHKNKIKNIDNEVYTQNYENVRELLNKSFLLKSKLNINKLDINDIVIHIRSGDVFSKNPHPRYIPPPLSYYINILDNNNFKRKILICEDKKNPVVTRLLDKYPEMEYRTNKLEDDIKIILATRNIIYSVGTFIPSLLNFSDNIINSYSPEMYKKELENYYLKNKPWRNNTAQKKLLLTYDFINNNDSKNNLNNQQFYFFLKRLF